ncbi:MurR/RpiR family transcriptional regulator [Paenirhodobacter populi]|uniref:MurR/RpiR family transcriptional regulator n=1 Tax=Paenirhodobacter populi TaxID=2306993 RepID=A0A443J4J8_9RHOB|nr:MurR/RpiR family transcriptional regulator [Sinirhodobacter populi]RWR15380.1 MurR/RpiR family transcriptional regulator [Sinirhodobacter populi]
MTDPVPPSPLSLRLQAIEGRMTKSEAVLAQWLLRNAPTLGLETGATIAQKTGVSEITVSRFLRRLGYRGITALKQDLRTSGAAQLPGGDLYLRLENGELGTQIRRDAEAVLALAEQIARPEWEEAIGAIFAADEVFVTGFQSVKGAAEDFCRRLAIIHDRARFLAAHDSGLAEWLPANGGRRCLILIDTVPYAREAETMLRLAVASGMTAVVVTEELNTWAAKHTPWVFFVVNRVETYIESSGPLTSMLSLIVSAVAARDEAKARARLEAWPAMLRALDLF